MWLSDAQHIGLSQVIHHELCNYPKAFVLKWDTKSTAENMMPVFTKSPSMVAKYDVEKMILLVRLPVWIEYIWIEYHNDNPNIHHSAITLIQQVKWKTQIMVLYFSLLWNIKSWLQNSWSPHILLMANNTTEPQQCSPKTQTPSSTMCSSTS